MSDKNREQKQYDDRLRCLIQAADDLDLATRHGVPRSTARGWLKQAKTAMGELFLVDVAHAPAKLHLHTLTDKLVPSRKDEKKKIKVLKKKIKIKK